MVDSEKRDFMEVMTGLSEYYGREVSVPVIKIYWEGLRVYDLQAIREAAGRHIADPDAGKWMPKIADIVKMLSGTTGDAALIAWAKVDKAVRAVGTYSDVVFDDPIIHRVLQDMGGWVMLGTKTDHDWQFVAKEFETRYRGYKIRAWWTPIPGTDRHCQHQQHDSRADD